MNKFLKAFLAVALLAACAFGDSYLIPKDNNENMPGDVNLVGASSKYSVTYTSTVVTAVPALVYSMTVNSLLAADATGYAVICDTANAVNMGTTMTEAGILGSRVTTNLIQGLAIANRTVISFNPPIICENGIVVICPGTTGATTPMQWAIQYRNRIKGN